MADYSDTPLAKKLGFKSGSRTLLLHAPPGFRSTLEPLPDGVRFVRSGIGRSRDLDVILLFVTKAKDLEREFPPLCSALEPSGGLWVAWPKKSSALATDLVFEIVQRVGLDTGLVDNKSCAIDANWSGLRFVVRKADRPPAPAKRRSLDRRSPAT